MTPEERFERIERQLEFLAASQAQHDARIAEIDTRLSEGSRQIAENSRGLSELRELTLRVVRIVDEQARRMDDLAESQRRTDDRLNALIAVVERYFSNGQR